MPDGCFAGFDNQQWYRELFDYGTGGASGEAGADEDLVPRLVADLVLPLACHALRNVWNPNSHRQSRAASHMVGDILVYLPPDSPRMQVTGL